MCSIQTYVNVCARHYAGQPPRQNHALQAFVAATMLRKREFGIDTITAAAVCTGSSRDACESRARSFSRARTTSLVTDILVGRCTLLKAAKKVANRAQLIESFKSATLEDRIAFGNAVGAGGAVGSRDRAFTLEALKRRSLRGRRPFRCPALFPSRSNNDDPIVSSVSARRCAAQKNAGHTRRA